MPLHNVFHKSENQATIQYNTSMLNQKIGGIVYLIITILV